MKIPGTYFVIIILLACCLIEFTCYKKKSNAFNDLSSVDKNKDDTVLTLKAKNGQLIKYTSDLEVNVLAGKAAIDELPALKNELANMKIKLSKVSYVNQIVNHISPPEHDTIKVPIYIDTNSHKTTQKKSDTVKFSSKKEFYNLIGFMTSKTLEFTTIDFPDTLTSVSENIGNIFKEKYVLKITHSNPYVNTTGIQALTIVPDKKWYQTTGIKVLAGFIVGVYIEKTFLK